VSTCPRIDWSDVRNIERQARPYLERMVMSGRLRQLLLASATSYLELCERNNGFTKLVLLADERLGVRVRLHMFDSHYADTPHNHRWSFGTIILSGYYEHVTFGSDKTGATASHTCREGTFYALHHSAYHAISVPRRCVSLMLRGPIEKPAALWFSPDRRRRWKQNGTPRADSSGFSRGSVKQLANWLIRELGL